MKVFCKLLLILIFSIYLNGAEDSKLLRFPDTDGKTIVFSYAGDIWSTGINGGDARHLTTGKGLELFPKISPDGKWIAFSAQYSGAMQIYVMPVKGGTPKQLTFFNDNKISFPRGGYNNITLGWTSDSKNILYRLNKTPWGKRVGKYYMISREGGYERELPIPEGGLGSLSPDDTKVCYTPVSREFRNWKRYKGGRAADVWIYDLRNKNSERITKFAGTDQTPVWHENNIYFISDRDLKLNVYRYNTETKKTEQITKHDKFDALWLSGRNGTLVYENGGNIYKLTLSSGEYKKVTVNINFDNPLRMPYRKEVKKFINSFELSPDGKTALFEARGDLFTVSVKDLTTENITGTCSREISPVWSPDGRNIVYISDKTGEYEIYLMNVRTRRIKQLTKDSEHWIKQPVWSPDSSNIIYSDMAHKLRILNVKTGKITLIDRGVRNRINTYSFSKDSSWVVYTQDSENQNSAIWVYSVPENKKYKLTNDMYNDFSPVFSDCGNYIYFLSNRDFNLTSSAFESTFMYTNATKLFALYLRKNSPKINKETKIIKPKKSKKQKKAASLRIDFNGIAERVTALTETNQRFWNLKPVKDGLLFSTRKGISKFTLKNSKISVLIKNAFAYTLSADQKNMMYMFKRSEFAVTKPAPGKTGKGKLDLSGLVMRIDPVKEWNQIYKDAFRIFRDWFYVRNIHNVDWKEIERRYSELLPSLGHRADLDYILGEVIGETNTGHTYVNWGDFHKVKRVDTGCLGAEIKYDSKHKNFRISKIYKGENWNKRRVSPLTVQGINVKEGDFLISVDGEKLKSGDNPYKYLEGKAGKKVKIKVSSDLKSFRTYLIDTLKSEQELRYLDWVESRRAMVDKLSNGRIGYIHVPNTAVEGHRELFKGMYAFHNKEALIIDDRYNGGGFIPDDLTRLLERKTRTFWAIQGIKNGMKTPAIAHDGPKAMLINHYASSGGDCFPYYFRMQKLGTLIGTRTWGGLVGISGNADFIDGGSLNVPSFGIYDKEGKWVVEGIGIYPDIEVYDTPHLIAEGRDPSVEKAVEVLLKQIGKKKKAGVKEPAAPDRSKWIETEIK